MLFDLNAPKNFLHVARLSTPAKGKTTRLAISAGVTMRTNWQKPPASANQQYLGPPVG